MKVGLRKSIRGLEAYREVQAKGIDLSTNTNPLVNLVIERALKKIDPSGLNTYPSQKELREAIARMHHTSRENVIVGNGSDELIDLIFKTFTNPGERIVIPVPTFGMYAPIGKVNFAQMVEIPLTTGFQLDVDQILEANAKIIVICRPNNPTGNVFPRRDVIEILEKSEGLVVIDEAYANFMNRDDFVSSIRDYDNLVVLRTFSKAYGLAGIRVGYALANEEIIANMDKVRLPYNVNTISMAIALEALKDAAFVNRTRRLVLAERERVKSGLEQLGVLVYPSDTNFLLAKLPSNATKFCEALAQKGIWVKDCSGSERLGQCVRITIGTPSMNDKLLAYTKGILGC